VVAPTGSMLRIFGGDVDHHTKTVALDAQQVQQLLISTMKDRPAYLGLYAFALPLQLCPGHLVLTRFAPPAIVEGNGDAPSLRAISWRGIGKPGRISGKSSRYGPALCSRLVSEPEPRIEGMVVATK
jgi:hypothetical protein